MARDAAPHRSRRPAGPPPAVTALAASAVFAVAAWAAGFAGAVVTTVLAADSSAVASPDGSAEPSGGATQPGVVAWLDVPLPPDAPAGEPIQVGVTLWDNGQHQLAQLDGLKMRLHPATGPAKPTEGVARADWPGHLAADLAVPAGGAGRVELLFEATACDSQNVCQPRTFPVPFAGTGPPPEASRAELVTATVEPLRGAALVGQPIDLRVSVVPRAAWGLDVLGLPPVLIAMARPTRGPEVATAELRGDSRTEAIYSGTITIPVPGDIVIIPAFPVNGGADEPIQSDILRFTVQGAAPSAAGAVPSAAPDAGPSPALLAVGLAALVVVAGLVIRRVFADL